MGYVINNLLLQYGDISLVFCISTRLLLVTMLSLLVKYLVIGERSEPLSRVFNDQPRRIYYWRASEASETLFSYVYENSRYIYTKYSTLPSGISVYIVPKVGIFPEAGG